MTFQVKITYQKKEHTFQSSHNQTILEAAQEAGVRIPFACTMGDCYACVAKVIKGQIDRGLNDNMDEEDRQKSLVLTCQAMTLDSDVELDFD